MRAALLLVVTALVACRDAATPTGVRERAAMAPRAPSANAAPAGQAAWKPVLAERALPTTGEENAAVAALIAALPEQSRAETARLLTSTDAGRVDLRFAEPALQALADRVTAARRARFPRNDLTRVRIPTTVAIVPNLPVDAAKAVVLRRTEGTDRDVILLREADASAEVFEAALLALVKVRAVDGEYALEPRTMVLRSAAVPKNWEAQVKAAGRILDEARNSAPRLVPGVGEARTRTMMLPVVHFRHQAQ